MTETKIDTDQIRLDMIIEAFNQGKRYGNLDQDSQPAQWMKAGLLRLERGVKLKKEDIQELDKLGGTDHPDPFIRPGKKLI